MVSAELVAEFEENETDGEYVHFFVVENTLRLLWAEVQRSSNF